MARCVVCGKRTSFIDSHRAETTTGFVSICEDCVRNSYIPYGFSKMEKMSENDFKCYLSWRINNICNYYETESIPGYIGFDCHRKLVKIYNNYITTQEIFGFELMEDNVTITSGGLGAAVAGGVIGSMAPHLIGRSTGAIIGAAVGNRTSVSTCSSMDLLIILKRSYTDHLKIHLLEGKTNKTSAKYLEAKLIGQECSSFLNRILGLTQDIDKPQHSHAPDKTSQISAADEIKKYKELLDLNIITQEEFDAKKKQLLGF